MNQIKQHCDKCSDGEFYYGKCNCECHAPQTKQCCDSCIRLDAYNIHKPSQCGDESCLCHVPQPEPQEQSWEIEFEKIWKSFDDIVFESSGFRMTKIKSFIRSLLQKTEVESYRDGQIDKELEFGITLTHKAILENQADNLIKIEISRAIAELKEKIIKELEEKIENRRNNAKIDNEVSMGIATGYDNAISEAGEIVKKIK